MPTTLKCPNPSCPYLFDSSTVPAGVVLACPRCTMRFTLGAPATSAPSPGHPLAGHLPAGSAFSEMTPETARADGDEGPRLPVRGSRLQTMLLVVVAAVALSAAAIAFWYKLTHKPDETAASTAILFPEKNFSLEEPASPWMQDGTMQATLGSPYIRVYRRENPEAFIAIGARDYLMQEPRPGELIQGLKGPVARLMAESVLKEETIPEGTTWFGLPVKGFNFRGQLKSGTVVQGEAYTVSHQGIGYWFLAWTGENQIFAEQRADFAAIRSRCKFLDQRANWTAKRPNVVEFKNNLLGYSIRDGEGIWTEETDEKRVKDEDPKADKYLTAKIKPRSSDFANEAELVILVLDAKGDPLEQGRAYIEQRENGDVENRGKTSFQAHAEDTAFDAPNPVDGNAASMLLKSKNDRSEMSRLWAISAITIGDKTVVACAKCPFTAEDREQFERKFVVLVKSLRADR